MPNLSDNISDSLTIQTINLLRAAVGKEKEVLRMLGALERELVSDLRDVVGKTDFTVARMRELLSQTREAIGAAYGRIAVANQAGLVDIATVAAGQTVGALNAALGVALTSVAWTPEQVARLASSTIVSGGTAAQWWAQQDQRLRDAFQREMQLGQLRGETVDQLAQRVRGTKAMAYKDGIMEAPRRQAQALVRTSALGVANQARLDVYAANDEVVRGVQWMATLDPRTCLVCMGLDGLAWDYPDGDGAADYAEWKPAKRGPWAQWHKKKFEPAPIHFNCRCVVVPVTYSWKELAGSHGNTKAAAIADRIPENKRASMDGQVAASTTFDKWLAGKPAEFQDNVLGPARARAWRDGKVKLQGLADQSHNPLNLAQLGIERARKDVFLPAAPLPPVAAPQPAPGITELQKAVKEAEQKIPPKEPTLPDAGAEIRLRQDPADGKWKMQGMQMQGGDRVWVDLPLDPFDSLAEARRIAGLRGYKVVEEVRRFGAAVPPAKGMPLVGGQAKIELMPDGWVLMGQARGPAGDTVWARINEVPFRKLEDAKRIAANRGLRLLGDPENMPALPPLDLKGAFVRSEPDGWHQMIPTTVPDEPGKFKWLRVAFAYADKESAAKQLIFRGYRILSGPETPNILPLPAGGPKVPTQMPRFMKPAPSPAQASAAKESLRTKAIAEWLPGKGGSSEAIPVRFDDGTKGMFKPMSGENNAGRSSIKFSSRNTTDMRMAHAHDREVATSDIADIVGMSDKSRLAVVPGAVVRDTGGGLNGRGIGSMAEHVPGRNAWDVAVKFRYDGPQDHARAAAWDFLIGQSDRHGQNWMIDQTTGRMWLIDNGLAFPQPYGTHWVAAEFRSRIFWEARNLNLKVPTEVVDWLAKWPQIEEVMRARHFLDSEIQATHERLKILAQYAGKPFGRAMFQGSSVWEG